MEGNPHKFVLSFSLILFVREFFNSFINYCWKLNKIFLVFQDNKSVQRMNIYNQTSNQHKRQRGQFIIL